MRSPWTIQRAIRRPLLACGCTAGALLIRVCSADVAPKPATDPLAVPRKHAGVASTRKDSTTCRCSSNSARSRLLAETFPKSDGCSGFALIAFINPTRFRVKQLVIEPALEAQLPAALPCL